MSNDISKEYFQINHLKTDLKRRSVRGGIITFASQGGKFCLQMGSSVVLARLLTPNDYGLIGMVSVVLLFANLFQDLGLSTATIQVDKLNHQQVSTLFWVNVVFSSIVTIICIGLAPIIAWFYQEPKLTKIALALSTTFIISGLTVQHQALLQRQMQFFSLAKIEIVAFLSGIITAIISACYGFGYWSLVLMQIVMAIANCIGVWIVCKWRPGVPVRHSGIRPMLAFGGNLASFRIINYFSRNLDNILIGRFWGSQQLGLYSKAYQLVLLPITQLNNPMTNIALPLLSRLQTDTEKYCFYYYKLVLLIAMPGMFIVSFLFASADKIIVIFLGKYWLDAIPIFRYLIPAAFLGTFNMAGAWVFLSLNRTDRQLRLGLMIAIADAIIFLISVHWGAIGVAAAYGLSRPIIWIPRMIYCYQNTPLKFSKLLTTLWIPSFTSISAAALTMIINYLILNDVNVLLNCVRDFFLYSLFYVTIIMILPNGKKTLYELIDILNNFK